MKRLLILLVLCGTARAENPGDNAGERTPPVEMQGKTNNKGKSVSYLDAVIEAWKWLKAKRVK